MKKEINEINLKMKKEINKINNVDIYNDDMTFSQEYINIVQNLICDNPDFDTTFHYVDMIDGCIASVAQDKIIREAFAEGLIIHKTDKVPYTVGLSYNINEDAKLFLDFIKKHPQNLDHFTFKGFNVGDLIDGMLSPEYGDLFYYK